MSDYVKRRLAEIAEQDRRAREWAEDEQIGMLYEQCVYVVRAGDLVKIGITSDMRIRLRALRVANPLIEEDFYVTQRLRNASRIEKRSHQALRRYQVTTTGGPGREWFRCNKAIAIAAVERFVSQSNGTDRTP